MAPRTAQARGTSRDCGDRRHRIIGHSIGGMIAEKFLGMDCGAGAIGIDAAQIKGVRVPSARRR